MCEGMRPERERDEEMTVKIKVNDISERTIDEILETFYIKDGVLVNNTGPLTKKEKELLDRTFFEMFGVHDPKELFK